MNSAEYQGVFKVAVLNGDGVGPEVTAQARRVLDVAFALAERDVAFRDYPFGGSAIEEYGVPFPDATRVGCLEASAVLLGAVGGPRWDEVPPEVRPERGLLQLRQAAGTFANLRPAVQFEALVGSSTLKPDVVRGVDLLVVRELTGGVYFGPSRRYELDGVETAENVMRYSENEIIRIARVAFEAAQRRRGRVVSVDKANVLEVSRFWREVVTALHSAEYRDVNLTHAYVDSTAMMLVRDPASFDVILAPNMFGDILSDIAGALQGSLGMLPSASVGGRVPIYEPVHGSAPDIAGTGRANPCGAILSAAMLLEDAGIPRIAGRVRLAVAKALSDGFLTDDIARGASGVSTRGAADRIIHHLRHGVVADPVTRP